MRNVPVCNKCVVKKYSVANTRPYSSQCAAFLHNNLAECRNSWKIWK